MPDPWRGAVHNKRYLRRLASFDIGRCLPSASFLCLLLRTWGQHGPRLRLDTDTILADRFARRVAERWQKSHGPWLPPPPSTLSGLSREYRRAGGTTSLSVGVFADLLPGLREDLAESPPARLFLVVKRHGDDRGLLDPLLYPIEERSGFDACVKHPAVPFTSEVRIAPKVHGEMSKTSVMLAVAPGEVNMDRLLANSHIDTPSGTIRQVVMDRGVRRARRSNGSTIAAPGVIGSVRLAMAGLGSRIAARVVGKYGRVLNLLANQSAHSG